MVKFSVVMSVYYKDSASAFTEAVNSLLNQSLLPDEIIIVMDGPVPRNLDKLIEKLSKNKIIRIIKLKLNCGAGKSKDEGIKKAKYPLIAIMDSDDISIAERFRLQIERFGNDKVDVVGGWIEEFDRNIGDLQLVRKVPLDPKDIIPYSKWRNPTNHVSLMFKKEAYNKAGGYSSMRTCEDWDLVIRMISNGIIIANIPKILVRVRAGNAMLKRRGSLSHFKDEIALFYNMYLVKHINLFQFFANILLRTGAHCIPSRLTYLYYKLFLRN